MKVAYIQQALFIKFLSIYKHEKKKVYLFYTIKAVTLHHTRAHRKGKTMTMKSRKEHFLKPPIYPDYPICDQDYPDQKCNV